jgi:hypothetical protein
LVLGVSRQWVYEHAEELGGQRIGSGKRPRWRFDLTVARAAGSCSSSKPSQVENASAEAESESAPQRRRRRLPSHRPQPTVLAIRPRSNGKPAVTRAA